ncbi:hypothetical protein ACRRTK_024902 [Alexandromys fortis]
MRDSEHFLGVLHLRYSLYNVAPRFLTPWTSFCLHTSSGMVKHNFFLPNSSG